jgi:hypothetical protein
LSFPGCPPLRLPRDGDCIPASLDQDTNSPSQKCNDNRDGQVRVAPVADGRLAYPGQDLSAIDRGRVFRPVAVDAPCLLGPEALHHQGKYTRYSPLPHTGFGGGLAARARPEREWKVQQTATADLAGKPPARSAADAHRHSLSPLRAQGRSNCATNNGDQPGPVSPSAPVTMPSAMWAITL